MHGQDTSTNRDIPCLQRYLLCSRPQVQSDPPIGQLPDVENHCIDGSAPPLIRSPDGVKVLKKAVFLVGTHCTCNQDCYHERVNCNYPGHDHGNQGLHVHRQHSVDLHTLSAPLQTFIIRSGRNVPTPAMPMPAFAVPYAAPAPAQVP